MKDRMGQIAVSCARIAAGKRKSRASIVGVGEMRPPNARQTASTVLRWSFRRARCRECVSVAELAQIDALLLRGYRDSACRSPTFTVSVSKNVYSRPPKPSLVKPAANGSRWSMDVRAIAPGLWAVIDRIHRGDHRQQHLRGADVARWLSRGGCAARGSAEQGDRPAPRADHRHADDAAGQRRCRRPRRHVGGMRSAIAERHAEALGEPTAMSAPSSPGGVSSVSARGRQRPRKGAGVCDRGEWSAGGRGQRRRCRDMAGPRRRRRVVEVLSGSPMTISSPAASARVRSDGKGLRMAILHRQETLVPPMATRSASAIASAAAVASSSSDALATSRPVRSQIMVWKLAALPAGPG